MRLDVPSGERSREPGLVHGWWVGFAGQCWGEPAVEVSACGHLAEVHAAEPSGGGRLASGGAGGREGLESDVAARSLYAGAAVLVQGHPDGVGGDVEGVHDPGAGGLEVAEALGALDRDVGAEAVHQVPA